MNSIYHILDKIPEINPYEIEIEYEELANSLVASGKMRIDTDLCCNFARFTDPKRDINFMVSKEELKDPRLIPETRKIFENIYKHHLSYQELETKIKTIFKNLLDQIKKLLPVDHSLMLNLARIFVQSAHPIVIKWLLHDKVEVFITYSHNIGDMMDMVSWRISGGNSGMQRTDGKNIAIFVSCGGNPFAKNNPDYPFYGDGWPALARMQIIAGQEIGHFADIMRDRYGRQIGRHSANFLGTMPTENARVARLNDINICDQMLQSLIQGGLSKLISYDESLKFYAKNKVTGLKVIFLSIMQVIYKYKLLIYAHNNKLFFVKRFKKDIYPGLMIRAIISDMKANLTPNADVYKRNNKNEEEAIACIEALARVPQQVMKWGHLTTSSLMKNLYQIYYKEVIPSLIQNYQSMTGKFYRRHYAKPKKPFAYNLKKIFKKEEYIFKPIREV